MLSAKKVLAASMDYTDESVAGAGAIKGAPCEIKSITPITGGNTVTFKWLDSNNVEHTSTMDVMDGQDGEDGKGIASVTINAEGHLIITYTDGSTSDAGEIEVQSAVDSVNGQTGEVVLTASDVNALPDDTTLADLSGDSTHRTVTDAEKTAWNAKSDFSGSYDDLTDKPSIPDEISDLNDTAISSPTNGQVMTYDSGKWKNADNNPTITVDSALSTTSENPVQNKVLTTEINKKAEYEEISWEDYQALSYEEKHNGKQYFVTGAPGSAVSASGVSYDNTTSGMTADNVQDALDEIAAGGGQVDSAMSTTSTNPLQNKVITLEVQDMRASMLNDELKLSVVELAVSQLQTSALNTELRLSTAELAVSQLQTSMLNMDGAVDDIEDEIADIVNVYGAKNLIPYPYLNKNGTEFRGVTYTVNADRSITANGTATGGDSAFFILQRNFDNDFLSRIGQGKFILSGCPAGGSLQTYYLNFNYGDAQSSVGNLGQDTGNGKEITIDTDITQYNAQISVLIREGVTVSNLTFKPMLRMASVKDDTYVLYAKTNRELTIDNAEQQAEVNDIVNVYGSKNLLSYPYLETSHIESGITFTDLGDGTIKANGTATADANFICHFRANTDKNNLVLPNGKYILSGCPLGGASSKYLVGANRTLNGAHDPLGVDFGDGVEITLNGDDYSADKVDVGAYIQIKNGTTVNNLVFKPMIRLASIKDNTYVPYAPTNTKLNEEKMSYADNGVLGAKNLLKVPYHHNTGVEFPVGDSVTNAGITYIHNANHSIKASGTATGGSYCIFNRKQDWGEFDLYGKEVTLSVSPVSNSVYLQLYDTDNSKTLYKTDSSTGKVTFTFPAELKNNTSWNISIDFPTGAEPNNVTYYPMLRLASDSDDTYQPYAMTNKELTDRVIQSVVSVNRDTTTTNSGTIRLYRYGNLRILTGNFNPSVAGTSAANSHIADLPLATDYPTNGIISVCGRGETDSSATAKIGNLNIGPDGIIKYQGQATGENMFFNITWVVE